MRSARLRRAQGRVSRALSLVALIPVFSVSLATSAYADLLTASGSAFGEQVNVTLRSINVTSGPLPSITAPPGGTASLITVTSPGMFQASTLAVSSNASTGPSGSVTSTASAVNISIGSGALTVSVLNSQCHIDATGQQTGGATIGTITVAGTPQSVGNAPNTTVNLPGAGTATLNEQVTTANSITVNALHVHLAGTLGNGDIIVSQSKCSATPSGVQVPAGAFGGVLLTGLVALAFVGYQRRSRLGW